MLRALCAIGLCWGLAVVGSCARSQPETAMLIEGQPAPALSAVDHLGANVALGDLGRPTIVYFYPKDDTPGCTKEACAFRDAWDRYAKAGVRIVGVSADDLESHRKFADKYHLPFGLVADTDLSWAHAFGVQVKAGTPKRISFLLAADGRVLKTYPGVDPAVHADEVLADAAALAGAKVD